MIYKIILFVFLCLFSAQISLSQADPLTPTQEAKEGDYGILVGLGTNFQTGDFYTYKSCNCVFSDGSKLGYSFGAFYQKEFAKSLKWGAMLLYENKSINSSYRAKEIDVVSSQLTNKSENLPLEYRYKAESQIAMVSVLPYLDISLLDFFVTRVGLSASTLAQAEFTHSKELLQNTARLSTGEVVKVSLKDVSGNSQIIDKAEFQDKNSLQFGAFAMLGANIRLSNNLYFSPVFQYSIPFTNISESGNSFKVHSWRFFAQISIRFGNDLEFDK
ncbi:MAG: hypothetical protein GX121_00920 [Ignavibacteria bacterium]|jgi:hypothetical protein|nr:hypothetical protein [Ignavibacteria bacterium]